MEKKERQDKIIESIKELEKLNAFYTEDESISDYAIPMLKAALISELLLAEVLIEKGFTVKNGIVFVDETKTIQGRLNSQNTVLSFCTRCEDEIIPQNCKRLIKTIQIYRNETAHGSSVNIGEMREFYNAFRFLMNWFTLSFDFLDGLDDDVAKWFQEYNYTFFVNGMQIEVETLPSHKAHSMQIIEAYFKKFYKTDIDQKPEISVARNDVEHPQELMAMALNMMGKCLDAMDEMKKSGVENTEIIKREIQNSTELLGTKLDNLSEDVKRLAAQIDGYKYLVERQIDMAASEEEVEHIVHAYVDECADRIVKEIEGHYKDDNYDAEKEKLILSLGQPAWNKMDEASQGFLISAKVIFNNLVTMKSAIDYSGVCLLVSKAFEVEISKRFFRDYIAYLSVHYPWKSNKDVYPTTLLNRYGKPMKPHQFALGNVSYVLCQKFAEDTTDEQKQNDKDKLIEYLTAEVFVGKNEDEVLTIISEYAEDIETVKDDYRNPSAHTKELTKVNAEDCFNLVLDVEKLLKTMLDSFEK